MKKDLNHSGVLGMKWGVRRKSAIESVKKSKIFKQKYSAIDIKKHYQGRLMAEKLIILFGSLSIINFALMIYGQS